VFSGNVSLLQAQMFMRVMGKWAKGVGRNIV
jgi:hypothetical protein